jgi:hypothetical protein
LESILAESEPLVSAPTPSQIEPVPIAAPAEATAAPEPIVGARVPISVAPEPTVATPQPIAPVPEPIAAAPRKAAPRPEPATLPSPAKAAKAHKVSKPPKPAKAQPVVLRPLKRLPPLAMWARIDEPIGSEAPPQAPHARNEDDDAAALMGSLRVPVHVLAVSYPRRPYIHRVRSNA